MAENKQKTVDRGDVLDLGVPMLEGDPSERQGPEDAFGPGQKRGDYSQRVGDANYHPHQVVPVENPKEGEPAVQVIEQRPRASEIGEVKGVKGGVETV
jgi:hypothetical protein